MSQPKPGDYVKWGLLEGFVEEGWFSDGEPAFVLVPENDAKDGGRVWVSCNMLMRVILPCPAYNKAR